MVHDRLGGNWLEPGPLSVRLLLVGLMFASLLMSVAIDDAFGDRAWLFVTGYLLLQIGRSTFLIVALRGRVQGEHFVNVLVWSCSRVACGSPAPSPTATTASCSGGWRWRPRMGERSPLHWLPGRGRRTDLGRTEIAGAHLVERFRLFFIIVLGETILTTGNAFANEPFELERLLALAIGFTGTVALWWCYFERAEGLGAGAAEEADDAGAVGLWGTWTLSLIVLALLAIAVGDELAIAHPGDDPTLGFVVLTFGGPALFLVAQIVFHYEALGHVPGSRPLGLAALAVLALATAPLTLIAGIAASAAVLVAVAAADTVGEGNRGPGQVASE